MKERINLKTSDRPVFFTADLHFGHSNILKFCPKTRKGTNSQEHDEFLIATWNETVAPDDIIFIVGDVFFCNEGKAHGILARLNGNKHLIIGNHDEKLILNSPSLQAHFKMLGDHARITIDGQTVVLFHYPIYEWRDMHRGAFHFHGHVHGSPTNIAGRIFDVGLDTRPGGDMKPWAWEELKSMMMKLPIREHH